MRWRAWRWWLPLAVALLLVGSSAGELAIGVLVGTPNARGAPITPPEDVREVLDVAREGVHIRAWVLGEPAAVRGTILVLHGIRSSKLGSLSSARAHAARGYRTVIVDSRGHGESSGEYLSYGYHEARDLRGVTDELERRSLLARPLYVIGSSYGAATALQYAALDARVTKVVAIAPFASLREVVSAYLRWKFGMLERLIPAFWIDARIDEAGERAGFDPDQVCPRCVAPQLKAAVLLIHSRDDERIPYQHSEAIRAALGERAQLQLVAGVGHVASGRAPGVGEAIVRFLDASE